MITQIDEMRNIKDKLFYFYLFISKARMRTFVCE